jgi:hypothetical protein
MKILLSAIFLSLLFASCAKEEQSSSLFISGILICGEHPQGVQAGLVENGSIRQSAGVRVFISSQGQEWELLGSESGYKSAEAPILLCGGYYVMRAKYNGGEAFAEVQVPDTISLINSSPTEFTVNPSQPSNIIFSMLWTHQTGVSYFLTLDTLGSDHSLIPFPANGGGQFENNYKGPYENAGLVLLANDFKYDGLHRLRIWSVEGETRSLYFSPLSDSKRQVVEGDSNVSGGKGWMAGSSVLDVFLNVSL